MAGEKRKLKGPKPSCNFKIVYQKLRALMQRSSAPNFHMVFISQKPKTDYSPAKAKTTTSSNTECLGHSSMLLKGDGHPESHQTSRGKTRSCSALSLAPQAPQLSAGFAVVFLPTSKRLSQMEKQRLFSCKDNACTGQTEGMITSQTLQTGRGRDLRGGTTLSDNLLAVLCVTFSIR